MRSALLLCAAFLIACSGGGKSAPPPSPWDSVPLATPTTFTPGTSHVVIEATLDAAGGLLEGPAGSPVAGVKVTFPPGALRQPTVLSLGYDDGTFSAHGTAALVGPVLSLTSAGQRSFDAPVIIDIPAPATGIVTPFAIDARGTLTLLSVVEQTADRLRFSTFHFTHFATFADDNPDDSRKTSFRPETDGFEIANHGSPTSPGGDCYGMSSFALWYFKYYRSHGALHGRFIKDVPSSVADQQPVSGEQLIAGRAQASIVPHDAQNMTGSRDNTRAVVDRVKAAIRITGAPVAVGLEGERAAHAVVAFGYTLGGLGVYDPNAPGKESFLGILEDAYLGTSTLIYNGYTMIVWGGDGSFVVEEPYSAILRDAEAGFSAENQAHIEITSPVDGTEVQRTGVVLEGKVHSGVVAITEIQALVVHEDSTSDPTDPLRLAAGAQDFLLPLTLKRGTNYVLLRTRGMRSVESTDLTYQPNDRDWKPIQLHVGSTGWTGTLDFDRVTTTITQPPFPSTEVQHDHVLANLSGDFQSSTLQYIQASTANALACSSFTCNVMEASAHAGTDWSALTGATLTYHLERTEPYNGVPTTVRIEDAGPVFVPRHYVGAPVQLTAWIGDPPPERRYNLSVSLWPEYTINFDPNWPTAGFKRRLDVGYTPPRWIEEGPVTMQAWENTTYEADLGLYFPSGNALEAFIANPTGPQTFDLSSTQTSAYGDTTTQVEYRAIYTVVPN